MFSITAPVEKSEVDSFETFFHKYKKIGYSKFVVDGVNFNSNLDDALDEISHYQHIEVVIDKLRIQSDMFSQILHSLEQAVFIGEGLVRIDIGEMQETTGIFQNACKEHHVFLCELQAKYFIFNNSENAWYNVWRHGDISPCKSLHYCKR